LPSSIHTLTLWSNHDSIGCLGPLCLTSRLSLTRIEPRNKIIQEGKTREDKHPCQQEETGISHQPDQRTTQQFD
jgi:hypothetical protein